MPANVATAPYCNTSPNHEPWKHPVPATPKFKFGGIPPLQDPLVTRTASLPPSAPPPRLSLSRDASRSFANAIRPPPALRVTGPRGAGDRGDAQRLWRRLRCGACWADGGLLWRVGRGACWVAGGDQSWAQPGDVCIAWSYWSCSELQH